MEFLAGLVVGVFASPFILWCSVLFLFGFPIFFWGEDIYENGGWNYKFARTIAFMILSLAVLHFFTDFDALTMFTGGFWASVLNLWLYAVLYVVVGVLFSFARFAFYAREYRKRMDYRLSIIEPGTPDFKRAQEREFKNRLSSYDSRFKLIVKWIFHWPWCLTAWVFTDLLRNLSDAILDFGRKVIGGMYGAIARANEPEWMKQLEKEETAKAKAKG